MGDAHGVLALVTALALTVTSGFWRSPPPANPPSDPATFFTFKGVAWIRNF